MRKRHVLYFLFIGFLLGNTGFSQVTKVEAIYKVKLHKKANNNKSFTDTSGRMRSILKEVDTIRIALLYANGKAAFTPEEDPDPDYLTALNRSSAKTLAGVRDGYYYNVPEKEVVTNREIWGNRYTIVYKLGHHHWKLVNETKAIHGYLCGKATTTYSYKNRTGSVTTLEVTAWYAPQIPIPLGPKNYTGLPGLVLELQEGPRTVYVTELAVNPEKEINIPALPEGKAVTEAAFEKIAAAAYRNTVDAGKNE